MRAKQPDIDTWVLFYGDYENLQWPNFWPVMISDNPATLRKVAEDHETSSKTGGFQLFGLPKDTFLPTKRPDGAWYSSLGLYHHEHLTEEDDDFYQDRTVLDKKMSVIGNLLNSDLDPPFDLKTDRHKEGYEDVKECVRLAREYQNKYNK